ncbi:hypothetical protein F5H01DRAFT_416073 [Linnemannia elongata]|nr:hypothetical protein F5H01DRAFT_416073 [Linnemannia elongata]
MKTSPHRSTKRKYLRRNHPNNQLLVIDTSLGRKKQPLPPPIPPRPALNIITLAPSTIAAVQSYHQQQQPARPHREGPPSPPAHLRASTIITFPPPSQQLQQRPAIPNPAHFVSYTPSLHHQHQHLQQQRQSISQQYEIHAPAIAARRSSSSSTYYVPAYSLRPYQQQQYLTARNSIRKPGNRYSARSSQPRMNQVPSLNASWNNGSCIGGSNRASTLFEPPMRLPKSSWSPMKVYQALRNNGTAVQQQQQQQQLRPRSDPSVHVNDDVAQPAAKANKSCIHLGFAAYMITSFMLAYNGIMSVLLLQASRAPDVFLFTATLPIFGFLALSLSSWTLFRVFHTMYLFTAVLTFTLMLAWLGVNQQQTGAWNHIQLDLPSYPSPLFNPSFASEQHEIWLKSFLVRDVKTGTWIISLTKWILAFLGIFLVQGASWHWGLLAYDRQLRDRKLRDRKLKEKNTNAAAVYGGGVPHSLSSVSEKV